MLRTITLILTLMLSGRMMTLAFIHRAGRGLEGDPPIAWLMPLIGDAVIGISGLLVAYLLARRSGLWVWATALVWNALGIWDAMSAYIVHLTTPWPTFFMVEIFGGSMFFMASAMHLALIYLLFRGDLREEYIAQPSHRAA